ncbi:MAG: hypothetical protein U0230_20670 [Polyangiales bacterium]
MSQEFLCYDVKGIQSYVFAVPRLRYIVGGSALLDDFDRRVVPEIAPAAHVYSAGGKGAFVVGSADEARRIRERLVREAHARGFDIAFGLASEFSTAANEARDLVPFVPASLDGEPCAASGLYPVPPGEGQGFREDARGVHPVVWKRIRAHGERTADSLTDRLVRGTPDATAEGLSVTLPDALRGRSARFFSTVTPGEEGDDDDEGRAGARSIGARNRWAIVAMDGNDMGAQYRAFFAEPRAPHDQVRWLRALAGAVDRCTTGACVAGIEAVLGRWARDLSSQELERTTTRTGSVVLPIRPLVVGGDDLIVLVHADHAMAFVKAAAARFEVLAERSDREAGGLFVGTGGRITLSAGVLYAPVSLPLSTAIPYAESLLASAKKGGRARREASGPTKPIPAPACVDWESVTEGLLDTPAARRQRELRFRDADLGEVVELTERPFAIADLGGLEELADELSRLPRSLQQSVREGLSMPYHERCAFVARLGKRGAVKALVERLDEPAEPLAERRRRGSRWRRAANGLRTTDLLDALLLVQESRRMEKETADA